MSVSTAAYRKLRDLTKVAQVEASARGDVFCTDCGIPSKRERRSVCGNCGSCAIPCEAREQVAVILNAHELRLLCHHAEKWGRAHGQGNGTVYSIIHRLRDQLPSKQMLPTLESEIEDETKNLKDTGG